MIPDNASVFPVSPARLGDKDSGKTPMVKWRKESRPREEWDGLWPKGANIGIDCGKSGLVALDEDQVDAVSSWLGQKPPETYTVRTGMGRHFIYLAPEGVVIHNTGKGTIPGLEVRAEGGYIVGPGSTHWTGAVYEVENDIDPVPLPSEALDKLLALQSRRDEQADTMEIDLTEGPFVLPEQIMQGQRNDTLFRYASSLVSRGLRPDEAMVLLRDAFARCSPPVTDTTPEAMWARVSATYPTMAEVKLRRLEVERYLWRKADRAAMRKVDEEEAAAGHVHKTARVSTVDVDLPPELPTVGVFGPESGQALFYPGQLNGIHGRGGTMKSWICLTIALQQVRRTDLGNGDFSSALLFDFEVGLKRTARRLALLGATEEERGRIIWTSPSPMFTPADKQDLLEAVNEAGLQPSLAVFDSMSRAMSGLSGNKGEDVNSWIDAVPAWILREWPDITDLIIDHLSKDAPESLHPTGAVQKYNAIQGAQYLAKMPRKASKAEDGFTTLTCAKDQEGNHTEGDVIAQFNMGPSYPQGRLQAPTGQIAKDAREAKEEVARTAIVDALLAAGDDGLSSTELKVACGGNAALHTQVREQMVTASGDQPPELIAEKHGKTVHYRLTDRNAWMSISLEHVEDRSRWGKSKKGTK